MSERTVFDRVIEIFSAVAHGLAPGFVLLCSSVIESGLQARILAKMRPLSNNFKDRLFEGYGPLGSFSSKIDISYALSIIDDQAFADLKIIKELRNEFAHPKTDRMVSFEDEKITVICKKFSGYPGSGGTMDNLQIFLTHAVDRARIEALIFQGLLNAFDVHLHPPCEMLKEYYHVGQQRRRQMVCGASCAPHDAGIQFH